MKQGTPIPALWFDSKGCGPSDLALQLRTFDAEGGCPAFLGIKIRTNPNPHPIVYAQAGSLVESGFSMQSEQVADLYGQLGEWLASVATLGQAAEDATVSIGDGLATNLSISTSGGVVAVSRGFRGPVPSVSRVAPALITIHGDDRLTLLSAVLISIREGGDAEHFYAAQRMCAAQLGRAITSPTPADPSKGSDTEEVASAAPIAGADPDPEV